MCPTRPLHILRRNKRSFNLIRLLTTAQNAFYQATHGKPHPNTGKGGGSAKILLHPNPLAGFTITAKSSAEGILIHITESDTAEAHRELVFRYLQFMLPGYTSQITQSKEGIHVKDISLSNLLDEQLQRQINYYGIIHEAPDGTIAMAMSVRKDTMMTVLGPRLRVCEQGYATAGGYNLEPGHPDIRQQAVKDSMTEFGVPLPPEDLVCIHNDAGHALLLAQMSEKPRLKPEESEFDPSSGQFFSIAQLVKDQLHLRDLPTLDHYLSKHRAPAIQAHLQRTLKFITSCHVSFNLEHTINLGSGQSLLGERYGTLTIELVFDEENAKKIFSTAKKYLARQLKKIDNIIFDQENNRIILPAKYADSLWLIVK